MARNDYYRTPHWLALKQATHERDGWRCVVPGCRNWAGKGGKAMTTAMELLAASHEKMTPDEIAANALKLADIVESLAERLRESLALVEVLDRNLGKLMGYVRQAQNLNATSRKSQSRDLIAEMAALSYEAQPDHSKNLAELDPYLAQFFNPRGSVDGSAT